MSWREKAYKKRKDQKMIGREGREASVSQWAQVMDQVCEGSHFGSRPWPSPVANPRRLEAFLDNPWQTNPPHPKKMQWWVFVFCFFVFDATKLWGCDYAATDNCYDLNIFLGGWRTKTSKVRDGESVLGNGGDLEIFVHSHGDLLEEFKKT